MVRLTGSFVSNRIVPLTVTVIRADHTQGAVRAAAKAARYLGGGSRHSAGLRGDGVLARATAHSYVDE